MPVGNMQKKFMADLEKLAKDEKVELVVNPSAANTGLAYFMQQWSCAAIVRYNFQAGYMSITIFRGNVEDMGGSVDSILGNPYLKYNETSKMNNVFETLRRHIGVFTGRIADGAGKS